jgi:hypothetical protein
MTSRANRTFAGICEQIQAEPIDYPSLERAFSPTRDLEALDTYCGPATRGEKTGNESLAGLDLNRSTSLAFRIGRSAYHREMRRAIATVRRFGWTCVPGPTRLRDCVRLILDGS